MLLTFPQQVDIDLLNRCVTELPPVTNSWHVWYSDKLASRTLMRELALAYSE